MFLKGQKLRSSIGIYLGRAAFIDFIDKIKQVENNKKPQNKKIRICMVEYAIMDKIMNINKENVWIMKKWGEHKFFNISPPPPRPKYLHRPTRELWQR